MYCIVLDYVSMTLSLLLADITKIGVLRTHFRLLDNSSKPEKTPEAFGKEVNHSFRCTVTLRTLCFFDRF